ncbi:MAG: DUF4177 domain-containing protein [Bacteroidota bacterium]
MQKFEYKLLDLSTKRWWSGRIDHQELTSKLNDLGKEGWEAVSCSDINKWEGASRSVTIIMKRPLNDN